MNPASSIQQEEKTGLVRFFAFIEKVGNKLPHPMWIFVILIFTTLILSHALASMGVTVKFLEVNSKGILSEKIVSVVDLLSKKEFSNVFAKFTKNILNNAVLGNVITISMFMSLAENTGFFDAALRKMLLGAPQVIITYALSLMGICANIAGDAGNILAATLGAMVYKSLGRNPVIGIITSFAAASAGYTANLAIANQDVTLSITTGAVSSGLGFEGFHPFINWYFLASSTLILAFVCTIISEKIVTPLIGDYKTEADVSGIQKFKLSFEESRGLRYSIIAAILFVAFLLWATVPEKALFRNPDGSLLPKSKLITSIPVLVALFFGLVGGAYGFGCGFIKKWNEIPKIMAKGLSRIASMILILAVMSQFIELFKSSKLATILSVHGQGFLESIHLNGLPLLYVFILLVAFINFFMTSGSNKYFILAPIFVPMFANLGIHPALTQIAYRIGDSCTNNISPLSSTLPIAIALVEEYWDTQRSDKPGIGTIISYQLPFSIGFIVTFAVLLSVFYLFNIPLGPAIPAMPQHLIR